MALAMNMKDWGHGRWKETFRHDCYVMFHSPAFWAMIAFIAVIALIVGLAAFFGGTSAGLEGSFPMYPMDYPYYPMIP